MRLLNGSFYFVALIMFAGVATAKIDACQPDGMSDVEATRIIAIATERGKAFRAAIDALRADGVSYETDTTYEDLMADPERAIALAKERHFGREKSLYSNTPEKLREQGVTLDHLFENRVNLWVKKQNVNFFATELISHLQQLAIQLGGEPTESPYRYIIDARTFVFALNHFIKGAKFKYIDGSAYDREKHNIDNFPYMTASYRFSEGWGPIIIKPNFKFPVLLNFIPSRKARLNGWKPSIKLPIFRNLFSVWEIRLSRRKSNFRILISLTTNPEGENITLGNTSFGGADLLKGRWPAFVPPNESCLATFPQMEK